MEYSLVAIERKQAVLIGYNPASEIGRNEEELEQKQIFVAANMLKDEDI